MTILRVTYISTANGVEWGGEPSSCNYPSAAEAYEALRRRGKPYLFCDGYALDFSNVDHLGVLMRVEFTDEASA